MKLDERYEFLKSKFLGAMLGSAIGDALGELAFRFPAKYKLEEQIRNSSILRYTDDTAMAIAVMQCLIKSGDIEPEELGKIFAENFSRQPWRGYGAGAIHIFALVKEKGYSFTQAAKRIYQGGSYGNGAAMRITPIGLYFFDYEDLYLKVKLSCLPTHAHPLAIDGAALLAKAISLLLPFKPTDAFSQDDFLNEIKEFLHTKEFKEKIDLIRKLLAENASWKKAKSFLGTGVTALNSVPFCLFVFLKNRDSFSSSLFQAILAGGDRDTIGCMCTALSGSYLGKSAIPQNWLKKLEDKDEIEELTLKLLKRKKY